MDFDFTTETITPDVTTLLTIGGTGALELPSGTTSQEPSTAGVGSIRWNTTQSWLECYNGIAWISISNAVFSVSGTANEISVSSSTGNITLSIPNVFIAPGSLQYTTNFGYQYVPLTATGTTQATAAPFNVTVAAVIGGAVGTGVILPVATLGNEIHYVGNGTTNLIYIYPPVGVSITGLATNIPTHINPGGTIAFAWSGYDWHPFLETVNAGYGISVSNIAGNNVITNTGITSIGSGTTGLTINGFTAPQMGDVVLAGTLAITNGGTGGITSITGFNNLSPLTTAGDLLYFNGTNNVRLPIGSTNQMLAVVAGEPTWTTLASVGVTSFSAGATGFTPNTTTTGAVTLTGILNLASGGTNANLTAVGGAPIYSTGSAFALGTMGTTGQVYISGGSGIPTWRDVTSNINTDPTAILAGTGGTFTASGATFVGSGTYSGVTLGGTPTGAADAVTKAYVDSAVTGVSVHASALAFADNTNTQITGAAYANGTTDQNGGTGIGATLTAATANVALVIDGVTIPLNGRVIINSFPNTGYPPNPVSAGIANGIYSLTTIAASGIKWVLTRATDYNNSVLGQVNPGTFIYSTGGTVYTNTGWSETDIGTASTGGTGAIKIGTDSIYFTQFAGSGTYTAGTGILLTGNVFSNTGVLSITTNTGLSTNASSTGNVTITNTGVTSNVAGTGISLSSGTGAVIITNAGVTSSIAGTGIGVSSSTGAVTFSNTGVTSNVAGTGISLSSGTGAVTITNSGVTSISGTTNQINTSASTGSVALSLSSTIIAPGSLQVTTSIQHSITNAITAAGTTQGTATILTTDDNIVTTTPVGSGVILPTGLVGRLVTAVNRGVNILLVYPPIGGQIDGLVTNIPTSVPINTSITFIASSSSQYYTINTAIVGGTGMMVSSGNNGSVVVSNVGAISFQTSLSGLTPTTATNGVITLAGTLGAISGGTGSSGAPISGQILYSSTGTTYSPTTLSTLAVTSLAGTTGNITVSAAIGSSTINLATAGTAGTYGAVTTDSFGRVTSGSIIAGVTYGGTGLGTITTNGLLYGNGTGNIGVTAVGTTGQVLVGNTGSAPTWSTLSSIGVTSFSAGTTGLTPASASSGIVTLAGTLAIANGGTGLTAAPLNGQIDIGSTGVGFVRTTITGTTGQIGVTNGAGSITLTNLGVTSNVAGTGISISGATGAVTITNTGVTSVGLTVPSFLSVSGSPVTGNGSFTVTLASEAANTVFAGPVTGSTTPTFRILTFADLPLKLYTENSTSPIAPLATGTNSVAIGSGSSASIYGVRAYANGDFATAGDAQAIDVLYRGITTNTTPTEIFLDGAAATQRLVLPNNSAWTFTMKVVARRTDATGTYGSWIYNGFIYRDGSSAPSIPSGALSKTILARIGLTSINDPVVTADAINNSLKVSVIGLASDTIRWVANINLVQVTN